MFVFVWILIWYLVESSETSHDIEQGGTKEEYACIICWDTIKNPDDLIKCKHECQGKYHINCFEKWMNQSMSKFKCPFCRQLEKEVINDENCIDANQLSFDELLFEARRRSMLRRIRRRRKFMDGLIKFQHFQQIILNCSKEITFLLILFLTIFFISVFVYRKYSH